MPNRSMPHTQSLPCSNQPHELCTGNTSVWMDTWSIGSIQGNSHAKQNEPHKCVFANARASMWPANWDGFPGTTQKHTPVNQDAEQMLHKALSNPSMVGMVMALSHPLGRVYVERFLTCVWPSPIGAQPLFRESRAAKAKSSVQGLCLNVNESCPTCMRKKK